MKIKKDLIEERKSDGKQWLHLDSGVEEADRYFLPTKENRETNSFEKIVDCALMMTCMKQAATKRLIVTATGSCFLCFSFCASNSSWYFFFFSSSSSFSFCCFSNSFSISYVLNSSRRFLSASARSSAVWVNNKSQIILFFVGLIYFP